MVTGKTAYGTLQSQTWKMGAGIHPFFQTSLSAVFQLSVQHIGTRADPFLTDPGTEKASVWSSAPSCVAQALDSGLPRTGRAVTTAVPSLVGDTDRRIHSVFIH